MVELEQPPQEQAVPVVHSFEDLKDSHFRVAIFGSARIKEGDPRHKLVKTLARKIAQNGWDLVTGGGPGLMGAASDGHFDGRGDKKLHSVGLTIKLPHEDIPNPHLDIKKEFSRFSNRLDTFMLSSDVVVVAPGGIGTLLELFYTWQLVQVEHICETPIILLGDQYQSLIDWMKKNVLSKKLMDKDDFDFVFTVSTPTDAIDIIKEVVAARESGDHVCKNFKKYHH
jgi:uncharacterized protein (TIGR00730 family)